MFAAALAAVAFVIGMWIDKIVFCICFWLLFGWLRKLVRRAIANVRERVARLRHRLRFIIGPTVVVSNDTFRHAASDGCYAHVRAWVDHRLSECMAKARG